MCSELNLYEVKGTGPQVTSLSVPRNPSGVTREPINRSCLSKSDPRVFTLTDNYETERSDEQ